MSHLRPLVFFFVLPLLAPAQSYPDLPAPPQDAGLPYTRSAERMALDAIRDGVALYPGSRYGYVRGLRVRLSEEDLLHGEALAEDGSLFVPASFAPLITRGSVSAPPVPDDLTAIADRWVYKPSEISVADRTKVPGGGGAVRKVRGGGYVDAVALARTAGLDVHRDPTGVVFFGDRPPSLKGSLAESVVTLFDTPEKFADPDIATRHIPILARQGKWTDHVKVDAAQLKALEGPATEWEFTPYSRFDQSGINTALFGSKVPPPGVYPRLLFSDADIPFLAGRVRNTVVGKKSLIEMEHLLGTTWLDPSTSDGKIFQKLSTGDLDGLEWELAPGKAFFEAAHVFKGQKPGIHSSHVAYVPECLTAMAMYALLTADDALGKRVATAVANYYKLREPLLDRWLAISDSEFGSSIINPDGSRTPVNAPGARTHWRNIHGLMGHMNLALSLDLSGKWMTAEQKDLMRRVIAKSTYGRRSHGQDGPARVRDVNWMAWDLTHFLAVTAIEGLTGFDPEAYEVGRESVRAFCEWGIDPGGVIFESNGKNGAALQFQFLSMVAIARRGENLFAHPHWRKLLEGQVQMTSPNGRVTVNSGTQYVPHSRQRISLSLIMELKAFFPESRLPDYLVSSILADSNSADDEYGRLIPRAGFDPEAYRAGVKSVQRLRLPSLSYPGFIRAVLYDADVIPTTRADLGLPLDFSSPGHGVFSSFSDRSPEAAWMNLMVRPDHYLGGGHHHADAGMFHFSALGVDWITESPFTQVYSGNLHSLVIVDGKSEPDGFSGIVQNVVNGYNAAGKYLGAVTAEGAAAAAADLTYSYSWRWNTQPPQVWPEEMRALGWEMDPSPEIARIFAGTARMKWRPWWPNYNYSNYIATSRAPFNPMEHVFRTTGLVRGRHPYGFVVDDVRKDDAVRLYQWTAALNGVVARADVPGLPAGALALGSTGRDSNPLDASPGPVLRPSAGDPILLVYALGLTADRSLPLIAVERLEGPAGRKGEAQYYDRLTVNHRASSAAFRILLVPARAGEPLPEVSYDAGRQEARISWKDQSDTIRFSAGPDKRTLVSVRRDDQIVLEPLEK